MGLIIILILVVLSAALTVWLLFFRRKAGENIKAGQAENELPDSLESRRKELFDFAVGICDRKIFLEHIYEGLQELRSMPDGKARDARADALSGSLRERMHFTREIDDFYSRSEELYQDFNKRLAERFPNLTQSEHRLCDLLRQGFSSRHIAALMSITPKSVEISRYRLRTKLGLGHDDNLIQFIQSI